MEACYCRVVSTYRCKSSPGRGRGRAEGRSDAGHPPRREIPVPPLAAGETAGVSPRFGAARQCKKKEMQQGPENEKKWRLQDAAAAKNLHASFFPSVSFSQPDLSAATASMASLRVRTYVLI